MHFPMKSAFCQESTLGISLAILTAWFGLPCSCGLVFPQADELAIGLASASCGLILDRQAG